MLHNLINMYLAIAFTIGIRTSWMASYEEFDEQQKSVLAIFAGHARIGFLWPYSFANFIGSLVRRKS